MEWIVEAETFEDLIDGFCNIHRKQLVRCKECKYRIVNEHFGKKGYMNLKARCALDTGDPFELGRNAEDDDWYCADGERKDDV